MSDSIYLLRSFRRDFKRIAIAILLSFVFITFFGVNAWALNNLTISTGTTTNVTTSGTAPSITYTANGTNAVLNVTTLTSQLATNNVTISATGNVTFSTAVTEAPTSTTQRTFTVNAGGSITVSSAITLTPASSGGTAIPAPNVVLTAGSGGSVTVSAAINTTGGAATSNGQNGGTGGAITITGPAGVNISGNLTSNGGGAKTNGTGGTGGAASDITITGASGITLTGNITPDGANGQAGTGANGNIYISDGATTVTTGGGVNDGQTAGVIDGGNFTQSGTGNFYMAGANTYNGTTIVSAGTLQLGSASTLGTTSGVSVTSGAVLDLNGVDYTTSIPLTLNGTGISGGGALISSSTTAATYAGLITLGGPSSIVAATGAINITNTGTITGSNYGLTLGGAAGGYIYSIIGTGIGTLTVNASGGTWVLAGVNTYTGATTVSAGILKFGGHETTSGGPVGSATGAGITIASGAAMDLAGWWEEGTSKAITLNGTGTYGQGALTNSGGADEYEGPITLASASTVEGVGSTIALTNTVTGAGYALTLAGAQGGSVSGIISGAGTTVIVDAGTWTLSGVNTYTGGTTISGGTLVINAASIIPSSGTVTMDGGTFSTGTTAFTESMGPLDITSNGGTISYGSTTVAQPLKFAASSTQSWGSGGTLTIDNWQGAYNGTAGTEGRLYAGNANTGLGSAQLLQMQFFNGTSDYPAGILSSGEIVAEIKAPSNLSYNSPNTYTAGTAISPSLSPTVTGTVTGYTVSPALPTGLSINATSGVISGTPTVAGTATYTVTATNSSGSTTFGIVITVNPAALSKFVVEAAGGGNIGTQVAGTAFNIEIIAEDAYGNTVTSFNSTVALTENQPYGFITPTTSGTFTNGILSSQSVTLTQAVSTIITATSGSTGSSNSFTVNAGAFAKLQILAPGETAAPGSVAGYTGTPTAQTAGTAFTVTVNAVDANWNVVSSTNTVAITSSDANAVLPTNAAMVAGTKTFSVTLKTAPSQTVTATDATTGTITANTSPSIPVNAGTFTKLQILVPGETAAPGTTTGYTGTPSTETAGTAFNVTVNAVDAYSNVVSSAPANSVAITSSDGNATLPANANLSSGTQTFSVTLKTVGTQTVTATDASNGAITASTSPSITVVAGALSQFVVESTTGGTIGTETAGTAFNIKIVAEDAYGNTVTSFNSTVALTENQPYGTISPITSGTFTNGVLSSQSVTLTQAVSTIITATSGSASGNSNSFAVNAGAFAKLQILVPGETAAPGSSTGYIGSPNSEAAGTAFTVTVNAVDANWNVVTSAPANSIAITSSDAGAILPGNANLSSGTQTFSVTLKTVGTQTVTATDATTGTYTANTSPGITVTAGALSKFVVESTSNGTIGSQVAGTAFNIKIVAEDAYGNTVTSFNSTVALTENQPYGTISPTTSGTFTNGVLSSQSVTLTQAYATSTITATSGSATGTSNSFAVTAGTITKLQVLLPGQTAAPGSSTGYTGTPTAQTAGSAFTVTVNAVDANWNVVSSTNTVGITSSDANAVLPANAALVAGTQTFSITMKTAGLQTVTATDITTGTITANTSAQVTVNAGTFAKLQILVPGQTAAPGTTTGYTGSPTAETAGTAFNVTVNAVDAYWNVVSSAPANSIAITSTDGNATLPANANLSSGTQTFSVTLKTAGTQTVTATDASNGAITASTSPSITVNTGALSTFVITNTSGGSIATQTAGTAFTIKIVAEDAYGNTITTFNSTVALTENQPTGTISPTTSATFTNGVLSSQSVTLTQAYAGSTITATSGSATGTSNSFNVNAGAFSKLQILVPGQTAAPGSSTGYTGSASATTQGTSFTVTVNAVDANWNVVSTAPADNIHLTSTDGSATLPVNTPLSSGTNTLTVTLYTTGSQTITASDATNGSITSSTSPSITVGAFATAASDYFRSNVSSGAWTTAGTWQSSHNNANWYTATAAPTSSALAITILSGETVSVTATPSYNNLTVNGTYQHAFNGGTVPTATWASGSTLLITGATGSTLPTGLNQTFSNVTWDWTTQSAAISMGTTSLLNIGGTFTVTSTGSYNIYYSSNTALTINMGSLVVNGGTFGLTNATSGSLAKTLNIAGNVTLSSGSFNVDISTSTAAHTINVGGNWANSLSTTFSADVSTVVFNGSSAQTLTGPYGTTFYNLTIDETSSSTTVTSSGNAFTVSNNLTVTEGNLVLQAYDANYVVSGNVLIATNGTLTHSVSWNSYGKLLAVYGNLTVNGLFTYTVRSTVEMFGANTTVTSGSTSGSAFDIFLTGNSSGTIGASGPVVINDNFWPAFGVTGGTFSTNIYSVTANASLINNGGNVNINGGTLNVTGGLYVGDGTNGTLTFSSGTINVDNIIVGNGTTTGTFTQSGGTTNMTGYLTIYPSCSFICSGSPVINIGGNITNEGTYTRSGETVTLNGTSNQSIGGTVATTFNNLVIDNAAGITLSYNVGASNTVTFTSGIITTGTNVFTLGVAGTAGTVAGSPGTGNYVYGNFQRYINNTSSPSVIFNVGDASIYAPVTLAFTGTTSGSGSVTVSTASGNDPNENTPTTNSSGINQTEKVNRYWTVSNGGVAGFTSYSGTFNFATTDILNSANPLNFVIRKYNAGWAVVTTGTLTGTSSQATGMTTFGDIEIGIAGVITVATNPSNSTICSGTTTTFNSTSASYPAPTVQWYRSNNGGSTYTAITSASLDAGTTYSGYTSNTLTLTGSTTAVTGYLYEAVFTNINGTVTSTAATLTVNPVPGDNAGSNVSICTGSNTVLGAASTTGHTYSWSPTTALSSSTVSNPTANPTTTTAYTLTESITATGCSVSNSVTVTVNPVIASNTISSAQTICANATPAALTGSTPTGGSGTYTYLWQSSTTSGSSGFTAASGTDNTQSYSPPAVSQNTWFNRVITSGGCSSTSSSILITTTALPTGSISINYCDTSGYVQLTSSSASSYLWSNGATTQSTLVDEAGLYYVTITNSGTGCSAVDSNTVAVELVVNGDFSQGNTGFTSQYTYESAAENATSTGGDEGLVPQGLYAVDTNAHNYHPLFYGRAHTNPGTGNFMMINGEAGGTEPIIWSENITVQPNTVYYFSAWAISLNQVSPYAALQFSVNGEQVGTVDVEGPGASSTAGPFNWTRFYATWNSGSVTSVTLEIIDLQTAADGNDFGLDNISCSTLAPVTFSVGPATPGAIVCQGDAIDLTSNVTGGSSPFTYAWSGPNSFTSDSTNPVISNSTSAMTGTYSLTVTNGFGCTATGSTSVTVGTYPTNVTATAAASSVCSGNSTNIQVASSQTGVVYQLINNSTSANIGSLVSGTGGTVNLPTGSLTSSTTFGVVATNTTSGCSIQLSSTPTVSIATTPVLEITNQAVCSGSVNLEASGVTAGSTGLGTLSYWTNSTATTSLSNPTAVTTSGTYYIEGTNGSCTDIAPVVVEISNHPATTFSYTGSPYCSSSSNPTPTFSGGGVAGTFSSTTGLVFVSTSTGQINLSASTPGTYTVTNKIAPSGCTSSTSTSSVTITSQPSASFTYVGNALCQSAGANNPSPILSSGATAGTFSSTYGLTFVSTSTGQINIASSTPDNYAVTNTVAATGGCSAVSSTTYIDISAYSFTGSVTAVASPDTICTGGSTQLLLDLPSYLSALLRQDFNGANNWTTANNSSGGVPVNAAWTLEPDSFDYSGVYFNSNDYSQFYLSNSAAQGSGGTTSTILESPSMSSVGYTTLALDFFTYFNYVSGSTAEVQVSTDNIAWNTEATYTSTIGLNNTFVDEVVDLGAYINQPTLYVRFIFTGSNAGYWAIDNVSVTGYSTNYTYQWSSSPSGYGSVSEDPTGVAPTSNTSYYAVATNTYGCSSTSSSVTVVVNPLPTITTSAAATTVCASSSAQNSSLSYSATTNTPTNYSITWNSAALTAGLQNLSSTALPATPITVPIAANVAAGTYTGTLTVTNANGCASTGNSFTITINPLPTITTSATATTLCASASAQNSSLSYSATTNTPTNYTITWNSAAQTAGLQNVSSTALPTSPITVPVAANVAGGTYTGTLTVTNANSCASTGNSFTLTINPLPTITTSATAMAVCTGTSAQNSSLSYSATVNTPTHYTITWNSAAQTAGLQNVSSTTLLASPITVPVAANVAAGTYTGSLTVTNANSCASTGNSFSLTVNPLPTITTSATAVAVCASSSAQNSSLSYSATTNTPTNYTITWNSAAQTAGLQNVSSTALPVSPITVPVTANVAAGTYTGTLTVSNANGCVASTGNSFTLTVNPLPTITTSATATTVCSSSSTQNSSLSYSATTNTPTNYSITWNSAAQTAGLQNVSSTALPASPITVSVAANVAAGTYTGTLAVTNANSCTSTGSSFTLTINPLPTITTSATATAVCNSTSAQNSSLSYSATANTPTHYTITWNSAAQTAGLQNVSSTTLPASPITVPVAANVATGTYTGTLTVTNANSCASTGNSFTITVNPLPTITTSATATAVCNSTGAQNSSLSYSATTNTPTNYTITWNSTALTAGLQNVSSTTLPASPITVPVAANVAAGTYTGTLTVTNANSCASTGNSFTLTVNPLPTITTSATAAAVCNSTNAQSSSLSYSATANTPTNYTITWNSSALTAGLQNVSSTILPASPITVPVAANVPAGTYTGTLTVTNANSCASTGNSFTVTINPLPGDNAGANQAVCAGSTVTLGAASTTGHSYSWSPTTGLSSSTISNPTVTPGSTSTYSLTESITATGCSVTNSVTVTVVPYPNNKTVTPQLPVICSGSSTNILVANSDNNVNYQLRNNVNNVNIGSVVAGTGNTIDLSTGALTAGTTFNVYATSATAGCGVEMTELASVAVAIPGEWIGLADTNWNNSSNWCTGVPTSTTNVTIPAGTPYSPVISAAAYCLNLDIDSGNSLKINTGGDLSLYGNLIVGGTYTQNGGILGLVGSTNQSIPGITAYTVIVNDSVGATLSGNLVIKDSLELLKGVITTGTNLVDMYDTLSTAINAGNSKSYIFGNLRRAVGDTGYYMFPVGDTLNYQLAAIYLHANPGRSSTGFDSLTATFTQQNLGCTGVPGNSTPYVNGSPLTSLLDGGYWTIHPEISTYQGISYDVVLSETGYDNTPAEATEIAVVKRANCDTAWGVFGTHVNTTQTLVNEVATAVSTSLSSFSDFGIGFGGGGPLPIELVYLQANAVDNSYILVSWETALEINNYGFDVERSTDGLNWTAIDFVPGHDNSVVTIDYSLKDAAVTPNVTYYYRLKQIDNNGVYKYTDVVAASINASNLFTVSDFIPNPAYTATKLIINTSNAVNINVKLFDVLGRQVSEKSYQLSDGENELDFNTSLLSNATYIAVISTPDKVYSKSLVVIKN